MPFKLIVVAIASLLIGSGCVIHADGGDRRDTRPSSGTTTTTTTTTTETHSPAPAPVPEFAPMMSAVSAEVLEYDRVWDTSWQAYTMQFTDVADSYLCSPDMVHESPGSVVTIHLSGYETEDEFAACPTGSYVVGPDCDLWEGEACMEILWRDLDGFDAGNEYAYSGRIDISLSEGRRGEPYVCYVSTRVDGHPDLNFDFSMVYEPFELAPDSRGGGAICTM